MDKIIVSSSLQDRGGERNIRQLFDIPAVTFARTGKRLVDHFALRAGWRRFGRASSK